MKQGTMGAALVGIAVLTAGLLVVFMFFVMLGVTISSAQLIPQYSEQDWASGKAMADIENRQRAEYGRVVEEQRRYEDQQRMDALRYNQWQQRNGIWYEGDMEDTSDE